MTRGEAKDVMWAFFNDERVQKNATTTYNARLEMADYSLNLFGRPKTFGRNLPQMARMTRRRLMKQFGPLIANKATHQHVIKNVRVWLC